MSIRPGRPKHSIIKGHHVMIRFDNEEIKKLNEARGLIPKATFLREIIRIGFFDNFQE